MVGPPLSASARTLLNPLITRTGLGLSLACLLVLGGVLAGWDAAPDLARAMLLPGVGGLALGLALLVHSARNLGAARRFNRFDAARATRLDAALRTLLSHDRADAYAQGRRIDAAEGTPRPPSEKDVTAVLRAIRSDFSLSTRTARLATSLPSDIPRARVLVDPELNTEVDFVATAGEVRRATQVRLPDGASATVLTPADVAALMEVLLHEAAAALGSRGTHSGTTLLSAVPGLLEHFRPDPMPKLEDVTAWRLRRASQLVLAAETAGGEALIYPDAFGTLVEEALAEALGSR